MKDYRQLAECYREAAEILEKSIDPMGCCISLTYTYHPKKSEAKEFFREVFGYKRNYEPRRGFWWPLTRKHKETRLTALLLMVAICKWELKAKA